MKDQLPSRTANLVALGRAMADAGISHVRDFSDPTARVLVDERGRRAVDKSVAAIRAGKKGWKLNFAQLLADTLALRTTAIDTALRDALVRGARQVVILGAGYDGRAWRMKELAGVRVFEVDHPATQGAKRAKTPELPLPYGAVSFVPLDFERTSLGGALDQAGHDPSIRTCWIWEGVVMYLTHEAMRATLAAIASRSAPGSTLILNYHSAHRNFLSRLMFRLIGEPMISASTPVEIAADLRAVGFAVREDSGIAEWNARWAGGKARTYRRAFVRIVVSDKL